MSRARSRKEAFQLIQSFQGHPSIIPLGAQNHSHYSRWDLKPSYFGTDRSLGSNDLLHALALYFMGL